jgi:drug/metabolite transporter (DMT)-like permease
MVLSGVGVGFAALATIALALQSIAVRLSTRSVPVVDVVSAIFVGNLLVFVPATVLLHGTTPRLTPVAIAAFSVAGLLGSLLARVALFVGIDRLGPSRAESLKSTFPLFAVVAAVIVLEEQLTTPLVLGIALIVFGAAAVSWDTRTTDGGATGIRFPLAAAFLLGIDPVVTKIGFAEGTPALVGVTVRVAAAAAGFGVYLGWRLFRRGESPQLRLTRWVAIATLANTVYLLAYLAALSHVPISVVTPIVGASPVVVLAASAATARTGERLTARLALGVVVLVTGVALVVLG